MIKAIEELIELDGCEVKMGGERAIVFVFKDNVILYSALNTEETVGVITKDSDLVDYNISLYTDKMRAADEADAKKELDVYEMERAINLDKHCKGHKFSEEGDPVVSFYAPGSELKFSTPESQCIYCGLLKSMHDKIKEKEAKQDPLHNYFYSYKIINEYGKAMEYKSGIITAVKKIAAENYDYFTESLGKDKKENEHIVMLAFNELGGE